MHSSDTIDATDSVQKGEVLANGFWHNNAVFAQLLGMCPLLGVTTSAENGFWMGAATLLALLGSNLVVSLVRDFIPSSVRIPVYITIIAAFVSMIGMLMNAWVHDMYLILGLFIPLIVVNCSILGRAEAFASKNTPINSLVDALGMGAGFMFALVVLGSVREILGQGTWFGLAILGDDYPDVLMFILPPGAFIALGFILAAVNIINRRMAASKAQKAMQSTSDSPLLETQS